MNYATLLVQWLLKPPRPHTTLVYNVVRYKIAAQVSRISMKENHKRKRNEYIYDVYSVMHLMYTSYWIDAYIVLMMLGNIFIEIVKDIVIVCT